MNLYEAITNNLKENSITRPQHYKERIFNLTIEKLKEIAPDTMEVKLNNNEITITENGEVKDNISIEFKDNKIIAKSNTGINVVLGEYKDTIDGKEVYNATEINRETIMLMYNFYRKIFQDDIVVASIDEVKEDVVDLKESTQNVLDKLNSLKQENKNNSNKIEIIDTFFELNPSEEYGMLYTDSISGWTSYGGYSNKVTKIIPFKNNNGVPFVRGKEVSIDELYNALVHNEGNLLTKDDALRLKEEKSKDDVTEHRDIIKTGEYTGVSDTRKTYPNRKED